MNFINILNKNSSKKELIKNLIYSVDIDFAGTTINIVYNIKHITFNVNYLVKSFNKEPLNFIDQLLNDPNYYINISKLYKILFNKDHYILPDHLPTPLKSNIEEIEDNNIYYIDKYNNEYSDDDEDQITFNTTFNGLWIRLEFLTFIIKYIFPKFAVISDTYIAQQIFHLANENQDLIQEIQNIDQLYLELTNEIELSNEEKIEYFNEIILKYFPNFSIIKDKKDDKKQINILDEDLIKYQLDDTIKLYIIINNTSDEYNLYIDHNNSIIYLNFDKINNLYLSFIKNNKKNIFYKLDKNKYLKNSSTEVIESQSIVNELNKQCDTVSNLTNLISNIKSSKEIETHNEYSNENIQDHNTFYNEKEILLKNYIISSLPKLTKEIIHDVMNYYEELYNLKILPKISRNIIEQYAQKIKTGNKTYYFKK